MNVFFVSMTPIQRLNLWNTLKILLRYDECILRFDDTNPEAESVEYIENIIEVWFYKKPIYWFMYFIYLSV